MNRTLRLHYVFVFLCWCCLAVTPAGAQIVYDNGTPSKSGGVLSDNDGDVRFADDCVFAAAEVFNGIRFWGFYSPTDTPPLNDVFTAVFYGNAAGLPDGGNVLAARVIGNPGRTDTDDDLDGAPVDIYVYEAQFPQISLGAGQYWVSIYNNTPGDSCRVYYKEQAPSFRLPPSGPQLVGAPIPGLTNAESWSQYKLAIAGSVAPCATERPGFGGFTCPIK